jgi:hypothetical protein
MLIILAIWEAEIRRIMVHLKRAPGKKHTISKK